MVIILLYQQQNRDKISEHLTSTTTATNEGLLNLLSVYNTCKANLTNLNITGSLTIGELTVDSTGNVTTGNVTTTWNLYIGKNATVNGNITVGGDGIDYTLFGAGDGFKISTGRANDDQRFWLKRSPGKINLNKCT